MIKKRMMIGFLITFLLFSIIFQSCCNAKEIENKYDENSKLGVKANSIEASNDLTGSGYDYVINSYNIDMIVKRDDTFDITERIEAYFNKPKHGISREIPLKNSISRLDGTKNTNRARISNISVNEQYTISNKNDYKVLKIGDSNNLITGSKVYVIKYTYDIGNDPVKNADELYFNLIGEKWDTIINNVSFKIEMPKEFDKTLLGFSCGEKGSTNNSNVEYNVIGNTITGKVTSMLMPGEALTIRLTLPDMYFDYKVDIFSIFVIIVCLMCVLISYRIWKKYGRNEKITETLEFYPPEGCNPAEIRYIYKGDVDDKCVMSLLIYLASKGYLKIEEMEEKKRFFKPKEFRIIKLKEYDGDNESEKMFFNGLFECGNDRYVDMEKIKKIREKARLNGKEISLEEAIRRYTETSEVKESITISELYNKFYETLDKIILKLKSSEYKDKIFDSVANEKCNCLILMIVVIFILTIIKPIIKYAEGGIAMLVFVIFFQGFGLTFFIMAISTNLDAGFYVGSRPKEFNLIPRILLSLFGGALWGVMENETVIPCIVQEQSALIAYLIGMFCIALIIIFKNIMMRKRTSYGNEMLSRIKGFKKFLKIAEKPQLEKLVMENPEYFYDILPYAYVLGVSDKWIKQFKSITFKAPCWYQPQNEFRTDAFNDFFRNTLNSTTTVMSPKTSFSGGGSSSGGSSSGSSSSGGGSAGGGSGGGGGSSW